MNAYTYFKNLSLSVEPDMPVEAAGEKEATEEIIVSKDALTVSETENPIDTLNTIMSDTSDSEEITVSQDGNVIALIDTGVGESANVIDCVSVIEEPEASTEHGDAMLQAIVSQNSDAKILSIRAMNSHGFGTVSSLVAAMEYAISENVDMINLSLYARTTLSTSVLKSEIQKAVDAGITVIGAAGNDGVDVVDYVPGSVESAYIIGAAKEDGSRLETSNFGATVDYNVVAESTSEATALFTGYISKNGLDSVASVLNQGMIFETGFGGEEPDVEIPDEDFSKYEYDATKSVTIRYTYAYEDVVKEDTTIDSLFEDYADKLDEAFMTTLLSSADLYDVGDGTYKFKADAPLRTGQVVGNAYADIVFAHGNDNGEVITKGVSMDKTTGVATIDADVLQRKEGDFADIQVQVLIPAKELPQTTQTVNIENHNGEKCGVKMQFNGLTNAEIPLDVTGLNEPLTSDDFEVHLNGRKEKTTVKWNDEEKTLTLVEEKAATVSSIDIKIKKDTDAVFRVASGNGVSKPVGPGTPAVFYLPNGTDVSKLTVGTSATVQAKQGGNKGQYLAYPPPYHVVGSVQGDIENLDGDFVNTSGYLGLPTNLFGIDFRMMNANQVYHGDWNDNYNGLATGYNSGIAMYCHHASKPVRPAAMVSVTCKILNTWMNGAYQYFAMSVLSNESIYGGAHPQAYGGVLVFAVQSDSDTSMKVIKKWDDYSNKFQTRPESITVDLIQTVGNGKPKVYETATLNASNQWTKTWDKLPRIKNGVTYNYNIVEHKVSYYNSKLEWSGDYNKGYIATITNKVQDGWVKLHKGSANPTLTDGNKCYNLAGAEYTFYRDKGCTQKVGKLVTDKNGDTDKLLLTPGTYYYKETKTTTDGRYELDPTVYSVKVTPQNTVNNPMMLNVKDVPGNDPMSIQIDKIWNGEETPTVPSLAGTQFTVKYFDNMDKNTSGTPKRTWVLEVQKQANGTWRCTLHDKYLVKDKSDPLYKSPKGNPILPYGTYWIKETQHAPGYTFEGTWGNKDGSVSVSTSEPYITVVDKTTSGGINLWGGNEYTGHNKPHDTSIKIRKVDENGRPLAGAKFKLVDSKGKLISTKTSGSDGYVTWDKLYPDIYTVTEIQAPNGKNLLAEDIEIHLPMRITEEDIKKYNIDRSKLSEWDKEEQCYYLFDVTYEISNHATFEAPMTGGFTDFMTFLPLVGGMAGFAGVGAVAMKRKKRK